MFLLYFGNFSMVEKHRHKRGFPSVEVGRDSPLSINIKQKQDFINISVFQTTYETKHEHLEKQSRENWKE